MLAPGAVIVTFLFGAAVGLAVVCGVLWWVFKDGGGVRFPW